MPQNVLAVDAKDNASHTLCMFYVTHHRRSDLCRAFPFSHGSEWGACGGGQSTCQPSACIMTH